MRGKYIVIEGTDSSGKDTQSELLYKKLIEKGIKAVKISFPMYDTPTGKVVKSYLKDLFPEGSVNVDPRIACLYYAADRKYNMEKAVDYYNQGYYVILDRYTTSNLAHQGSKISDSDERFNMYQWIDKLEYWLLELPKPDITILLHVPVLYTLELMKERDDLDSHEKDINYLKKCEESYLELAGLYNWKKIECVLDNHMKSVREINEEILDIILKEAK